MECLGIERCIQNLLALLASRRSKMLMTLGEWVNICFLIFCLLSNENIIRFEPVYQF